MIRSALSKKASAVPLPGSTDPWAAPTEWAHVAPSSDGQLSSGPSEVSLPSSVDTYTTTSSSSSKARRTVAFGSVAAFGASVASVDSAGSRSTVRLAGAAPFGQGQQGAVVFQIYRFHSRKVLRATHALWVDDDGDCQYYVDYPETGSWNCRVFRGQDPFGPLVFTAHRRRGNVEITRHDNGGKTVTTLSSSGLMTNKYTFKGYDGSTLAWKQSQGGYELNSYGGDKGKTKTRLGRYEVREGTNSVEPDSTGSIDDAVADPNTAELALMAAFALDDFEIASGYAHC